MTTTLKGVGIVVVMLAGAIAHTQVVRPATASRPTDFRTSIEAQPGTSSALAAVLARSCGDCHSNTIAARWYTRVPPFSTLIARGATEGRKVLNFSEWSGYPPAQQRALLEASCTDAMLGRMPMKTYLRVRGDARLSAGDIETICSAARQAAATTVATQERRER